MRRWLVLGALVATAVAVLPSPAAANGSPQPREVGTAAGDFNGDGRDDLAVGAPLEDVDVGGDTDVSDAGVVHVIYGGPTGLSAPKNQLWDESDLFDGIEQNDRFGTMLATGDFDGDGTDDLAIGQPYEDGRVGDVHVLYGSPSGLSAAGKQTWDQDTPEIDGAAEAGDLFGAPLVVGNFGNGPQDDLAIGAAGEDTTIPDVGAVAVIYGSGQGLTSEGNQLWHQDVAGVWGGGEDLDAFGSALAAADFGRTPHDDLAVGVPSESLDDTDEQPVGSAGVVQILYASPDGLRAKGNQVWHKDSPGVAGSVGDGACCFGHSLAAANFGKGGKADLAVGVPQTKVGVVAGAGAVQVLYGSAEGVTHRRSQLWHQAKAGVPGNPRESAYFGNWLSAGDVGRTGHAELVVGMPRDTVGSVDAAGSVIVLYGSSGGVASTAAQRWHQDKDGVAETPEPLDQFGDATAVGNFGKGATGDLAVGVPHESVGSGTPVPDAGLVHVLYGTPDGVSSAGSQAWSQDSPSIQDAAELSDQFGG